MSYNKIRPDGYEKIPFKFQVAFGNFPRYEADTKFAFNPSVGNSQEEIWAAGGILSYLTTAETMNIASTDTDDDGAPEGTGAHSVMIVGVDNNWKRVSESVILNGTTDVLTTNSYLRVLRMWVETAGAGATNAGDITATASSAASVQASISAGEAQSAKIQFAVPAGCTGVIRAFDVGVGSGSDALFRLKKREIGGVFRTLRFIDTRRQNSLVVLENPILLPEKTDFTITAEVASGNPAVSASVQYWLVDTRELA